MAIKKPQNLQPDPADAVEAANGRSMPRNAGAWKLIRNAAYSTPQPQGNGSQPTHSQGKVADNDDSATPSIVRRPYLKPAFDCDISFRRRMQPTSTPVTA